MITIEKVTIQYPDYQEIEQRIFFEEDSLQQGLGYIELVSDLADIKMIGLYNINNDYIGDSTLDFKNGNSDNCLSDFDSIQDLFNQLEDTFNQLPDNATKIITL